MVLSLLVCLLVMIAVGGALFGPAIAAAITRGGGIVALGKRKFEALHDLALFRSKGDKAVMRWGQPPAKNRSK